MTRLLIGRFLAERPWQFALAVMLCALGMASAIAIVWLQSTLERHARRQAEGIDIVVGAKGSALQNVLAAVYYLDVPNGNISLTEVDALRANPQVAKAIPIGIGDSVGGARIVGSTDEFIPFYGGTLAAGVLASAPMDAVIGAGVARRTKLKLGDNFVGAHGLGLGLGGGGDAHDAFPYRVVGILNPTGRVIDETVVTPLESVWLVHEAHGGAAAANGGAAAANGTSTAVSVSVNREATFALIQATGPIGVATLPRLINARPGLQAAVPALESARLLASFNWVALLVKAFAGILVAAAMASLLGALLQALARREPDLALLRAMGATRRTLACLVLGESLALITVATLVAGGLLALAAWLFQAFALPGVEIDAIDGFLYGLAGLAIAAMLAALATIPVLRRCLSIDVAAQLSSR